MSTAARIGLFGGTFDPFHHGHLFLAHQAMQQAALDTIIVLPCHISPHKTQAATCSFEHRLAMARLACEGEKNIIVDAYEATQPIPSYSWRTVEHFRSTMPQAEFFWVLGYDQWHAIPQWANPEYLAKQLTFLVFARSGQAPVSRPGWSMQPINGTHPASATAIRATLDFQNHAWLHPAVSSYIQEKGLYRSKNDASISL